MDFRTIFSEYYTLFRGDSQIPDNTDPEWAIAANYGNAAIRRWANVDGEVWDQLWTTATAEGFSEAYTGTSPDPSITTYDCPDTMKMPGGFVTLTDPTSNANVKLLVLPEKDVQYQSGSLPYVWFTGDENTGFVLNLNFSGSSNTGWIIDFPMYKKPTYFDTTVTSADGAIAEDGTTVSECPDSSFIVDYMLAYRWRSTGNYASYQTAKADAEEALKGMQIKNGIGVNGNTWNLFGHHDISGTFGV